VFTFLAEKGGRREQGKEGDERLNANIYIYIYFIKPNPAMSSSS